MKKILLKVVGTILLVAGMSQAVTMFEIVGNVKEINYHPRSYPTNMFTMTFNNSGGIVKTSSYDNINGTMYRQTLLMGWTGTVTPSRLGFVFSPESLGFPNLGKNYTTANFKAYDTMPPTLIIYPVNNMLVNAPCTLKTNAWDNGFNINKQDYYVSYNNGSTWAFVCSLTYFGSGYVGEDSTYGWGKQSQLFTPTTQTSQGKIRVIVKDFENNIDTVISNTFAVSDTLRPTVALTSPVGAESWPTGGSRIITWTATDNIGVTARTIYLTTGGAAYSLLDSAKTNIGTYTWVIPTSWASTTCKIRIVVYDDVGNSASDTSEAFQVKDTIVPTVTVIMPTKDTTWHVYVKSTYKWTSADNIGVVAYSSYLSTNNGLSYTKLDSSATNPGSSMYQSGPPNVTDQAKIQVRVYDAAGNMAIGTSEIFKISNGTAVINSIVRAIPEASYMNVTGTRISVGASKSSNLVVYNVGGQVVFNSNLDPGYYTFDLTRAHGTFIAVLKGEKNFKVKFIQ